jgi:hypothetical protein
MEQLKREHQQFGTGEADETGSAARWIEWLTGEDFLVNLVDLGDHFVLLLPQLVQLLGLLQHGPSVRPGAARASARRRRHLRPRPVLDSGEDPGQEDGGSSGLQIGGHEFGRVRLERQADNERVWRAVGTFLIKAVGWCGRVGTLLSVLRAVSSKWGGRLVRPRWNAVASFAGGAWCEPERQLGLTCIYALFG